MRNDCVLVSNIAAEWYELNGFLEEAIYHALRCGDMVWTSMPGT